MAELAESVRRRVALKVIKLGMDTKAVVARLEAGRLTRYEREVTLAGIEKQLTALPQP